VITRHATQETMKQNALLPFTSLVTIVLMTLHITDDIVRGISPARADNLGAVVIFAVWLVGVLMLAERTAGRVIMLLGGLFAAAMPVLHMRGRGYAAIATSDGGYFFVWTLITVGSLGVLCMLLAARALWLARRDRAVTGS